MERHRPSDRPSKANHYPLVTISKHPDVPSVTAQSLLGDYGSASVRESYRNSVDPKETQRHVFFRQWWQEIAAIVLSAIAFVAIIVTLYPHNHQPLPQWPYSISVNALISIYAVIFKAAILFATAEVLSQLKWLWYRKQRPLYHVDVYDQASRGPLGSLKFLWSIGPRDFLATVGALIVILMVAMDPFTQQLLSYYDCPWPVTNTQTSLPRSYYFGSLGGDSYHVGGGISSVPPSWQSAIIAGLLSGPQPVPVTCATGNCTFPGSYTTLGFCNTCSDVSNQLSITNETYITDTNDDGSVTYDWHYRTSLPSGFSMTNSADTGWINWMGVNTTKYGLVEIIMPKTSLNDGKANSTSIFGQDLSTCPSPGNSTYWGCRGYGAASCIIQPCVRTLNSSITFGTLQETLLSTSSPDQWGVDTSDIQTSTIDLNCTTSQDRSHLEALGYRFLSDQRWLGYNVSYTSGSFDNFSDSLCRRGCLLSYSGMTINSLWISYLKDFFNGTVSGGVGASTDPRSVQGPQCPEQIFNWGNASFERTAEIFTNITSSMSSLTRQLGVENYSTPLTGITSKDQTCLRVRWSWLSFPAAMFVVACAFLLSSLLTQYGAGEIPSWKSSTLPMLLNVFISNTPHASDEPRAGDHIDHLTVLARQTTAQLGITRKGTGLVESTPDP